MCLSMTLWVNPCCVDLSTMVIRDASCRFRPFLVWCAEAKLHFLLEKTGFVVLGGELWALKGFQYDITWPKSIPTFTYMACVLKKSHFQLQEYDVIVYMDADILILGNIVSILESIPPFGRRLGCRRKPLEGSWETIRPWWKLRI